ncbi:hypothetical protein K439DRAFT_279567 [Ramaria rubella]|nr:hypothetical protein K439DRAFT_279567 [Ramaria rubella]
MDNLKLQIPDLNPRSWRSISGSVVNYLRAQKKQEVAPQRQGVEPTELSPAPRGESRGNKMATLRGKRGLLDLNTTTLSHNHQYMFWIDSSGLSHPQTPFVLLGYLQFFFTLSLVFSFLCILAALLYSVNQDFQQKINESKFESLYEIHTCAKLYSDNFCANGPSPIVIPQCHEWQACMERDASVVWRTKILAELMGEAINGFVEPMTWRTMIFISSMLVMTVILIRPSL